MVKRASWLSITPEPERELPEAVATLSAGRRPEGRAGEDLVAAEQARIERLILHGSQRSWLAYLHDVVDLITAPDGGDDPDVAAARARAAMVIANHHNLLLGLPGYDPARAGVAGVAATDASRLHALDLTDARPAARSSLTDHLKESHDNAHAPGRGGHRPL
jgi:hypothetical protein